MNYRVSLPIIRKPPNSVSEFADYPKCSGSSGSVGSNHCAEPIGHDKGLYKTRMGNRGTSALTLCCSGITNHQLESPFASGQAAETVAPVTTRIRAAENYQ